MTDKTITESEFREANRVFADSYGASGPKSLRAAFEAIGFTITPGPIPEPMNGEIVVTWDGRFWIRHSASGLWQRTPEFIAKEWSELSSGVYGAIRIFAEVKS